MQFTLWNGGKGYQRREIKRENQHDKTVEVSWSESKSEIEWRETFWEVKYK